jgi:putative ABC transport system substrate-binding protein
MKRRDFISLISSAAAAWAIQAKAQQPERVRRVGAIFGAGIDEDDLELRGVPGGA